MTGFRTRNLLTIGGLAAAVLLFLAVNVLAGATLRGARMDLTESKLYTLSEGTRSVLSSLKEPITLRFYYSRKLGTEIPTYGTYADRVRELLEEYVALSDGRLRLEVFDPAPFSQVEDRALAYGLQGVPVDQSGERVYFGLAGTNSVDDEKVIAFFQPERERFLEYDLTRLVYELANPKKPVVGVMSKLPVDGDMRMGRPSQPWVVMQQIRQFFEVKEVSPEAEAIPPDVGVLMLVHPRGLSDQTLYAVDQFVMRGGKLLALVDPHSEAEASRPGPGGQPPLNTSSDLEKLFDAWGIEVLDDVVAGDLRGAWRVRASPTDRIQAVDYPAWFAVRDDGLNRSDVVTGELGSVTVASAGVVTKADGAGVELLPLLRTSPQSMRIEAEKVRIEPSPVQILTDFKPSGEPLTLAARITGTLNSAFPGGPPAAEAKPKPEGGEAEPEEKAEEKSAEKPAQPHLAASQGPVNLIVVADTDILEDRFWVQVQDFFGQRVAIPTADNASFVINALDNLMGSNALISLRSRGESTRPFERVQAMRREAELQYRAKEKALQEQLEQAQRKLTELQTKDKGSGAILSVEEREEIERFRGEILATRAELRAVQAELRRDIERLEGWLRFANIGLMPLLIGGLAIGVGVMRVRRRAQPAARE